MRERTRETLEGFLACTMSLAPWVVYFGLAISDVKRHERLPRTERIAYLQNLLDFYQSNHPPAVGNKLGGGAVYTYFYGKNAVQQELKRLKGQHNSLSEQIRRASESTR